MKTFGFFVLAFCVACGRVSGAEDVPDMDGTSDGGPSEGSVATSLPDGSVTKDSAATCSGTPGSYPVSDRAEGYVKRLVTDECRVYWQSSAGKIRVAQKSGGEVKTLAVVNSGGETSLLATDENSIFAVRRVGDASEVVRVSKADGGIQSVLQNLDQVTALGLHEAVLWVGNQKGSAYSIRRLDLSTGAMTMAPATSMVRHLDFDGNDVIVGDYQGIKRISQTFAIKQSVALPTVYGLAVDSGHVYVASQSGLYDVSQAGVVSPLHTNETYFSVAVHDGKVVFARADMLEFGILENGVAKRLAKTGTLGSSVGLAFDDAGIFWCNGDAIERHEATNTL